MNLVYITKESNLYSGGGVVVSELIKGLVKDNKIILVCPAGSLINWAQKFCTVVNSNLGLWDVFRVRRAIPKHSLVHIHGISGLPFGTMCGLGRTLKLFYTEHLWTNDLKLPSFVSELFQKLTLFFASFVLRKIICVSTSVRDFFLTHGVLSHKLVVIHNPVVIPSEVVIHSPKEELIVSTVGNFSFSKGYADLANIIDLIPRSLPFRVCVAGSGSEIDSFKRLLRYLCLVDRFELMGQIPSVTNLLLNSDVYVQTSMSESFGLGIAQALSVGLPVVAYRVGGIPELVTNNENGYLVRYGDTIEFASRLKQLLDNFKLRAKLGKQAVTSVEKFTEEKFLKKHRGLYGIL